MAKARKEGNLCIIEFAEHEAKEIGLPSNKEFELAKAKEGIWVLTVAGDAKKTEEKAPIDDSEQKIIGMLRTLQPRDRIEGWLEKKLNEQEKKKLEEMLKDGRVIKFKSSEVFRKALYVLPKEMPGKKAAERNFQNTEKPNYDYTLDKDGFMVVKNELNAKTLSEQLRDRIKAGEIKGVRSFSGEFYIVDAKLLEDSEKKIISELMKETKQDLAQLATKTKLTPTLVKISAEFLKEDGQIMEKKRELYQYIE